MYQPNKGLSFNIFNLNEAADNPFLRRVRLIKISILYLFPVASADFFVKQRLSTTQTSYQIDYSEE